jgi:Fe-S oxidoreductase
MRKGTPLKIEDIGKNGGRNLIEINLNNVEPLPPPYDKDPKWKEIKDQAREDYVCNLDGVVALSLPKPKDKAEEDEAVEKFKSGLRKLMTKENNWGFLQPLTLSLKYCAKCQTCNDSCPVYQVTGEDLYRPTYRSEVWRRLYNKYVAGGSTVVHGDIDLNFTTISRLYELSYRCTMCRRCAQACPMGVDNALITHELRKLFSQELGWHPKELHEKGTMNHLKTGSSTGMNPAAAKNAVEYIDEDITEITGIEVKTVWDKKGADVLLLHNAGEFISWPENHGAFALILQQAGIDWTLSSDPLMYDGVNYGLFYDDFQLARIAIKHASSAKELGAKKIVIGECGHEHKAMMTISDRILIGDMNVPKESFHTLLEHIVFSGKIKFDPSKNNFPVTLQDSCNQVRNLGIVEPQRRILRYLCPQFREMTPHGIDNYCCGGGSGFAIMGAHNYEDWRVSVGSRRKFKQILDAFKDVPLQGRNKGDIPLLRGAGEVKPVLRRSRGDHRKRDGGRKGRVLPVGRDALSIPIINEKGEGIGPPLFLTRGHGPL